MLAESSDELRNSVLLPFLVFRLWILSSRWQLLLTNKCFIYKYCFHRFVTFQIWGVLTWMLAFPGVRFLSVSLFSAFVWCVKISQTHLSCSVVLWRRVFMLLKPCSAVDIHKLTLPFVSNRSPITLQTISCSLIICQKRRMRWCYPCCSISKFFTEQICVEPPVRTFCGRSSFVCHPQH